MIRQEWDIFLHWCSTEERQILWSVPLNCPLEMPFADDVSTGHLPRDNDWGFIEIKGRYFPFKTFVEKDSP